MLGILHLLSLRIHGCQLFKIDENHLFVLICNFFNWVSNFIRISRFVFVFICLYSFEWSTRFLLKLLIDECTSFRIKHRGWLLVTSLLLFLISFNLCECIVYHLLLDFSVYLCFNCAFTFLSPLFLCFLFLFKFGTKAVNLLSQSKIFFTLFLRFYRVLLHLISQKLIHFDLIYRNRFTHFDN